MKKETPMNINQEQNNKLFFGPLANREASVSLAELQAYVSSAPAPAAPNTRYMVVGGIVLLIGSGIFYFSDNIPSQRQVIANEVISPQPGAPSVSPLPEKQVIAQSTPVAPVAHRNYQPVSVPKRQLSNEGLQEKSIAPDPLMGIPEQSAMASNDPSLYVTIARIDLPELPGEYQ